jgi:hypothetical protein
MAQFFEQRLRFLQIFGVKPLSEPGVDLSGSICKVHREKPPLHFAAVPTTLADNVFVSRLLFVVADRRTGSRHTADAPLVAPAIATTHVLRLVRRIRLSSPSGQQNR